MDPCPLLIRINFFCLFSVLDSNSLTFLFSCFTVSLIKVNRIVILFAKNGKFRMVFPVVGYINFRRQKGSSTFPISLFCKSSLGFVVGECVLTFREFFLTELVNPLNSSFNTLK